MRSVLNVPVLLLVACAPIALAAGTLSNDESETLRFMREEEKLARDVYREMDALWAPRIFSQIAESEQRHMDALLKMIVLYGLDDPVGANPPGVFENATLAQRYGDLVAQGADSLSGALHAGAEIEEIDLLDLAAAIAETDEDPLQRAYSNLRSATCSHLRSFVSHIINLEGAYVPSYLDDQTFGECVGDLDTVPVGDGRFAINAGLNDMWYYPGTDGQGFSVTVFPGVRKVFLLWFTFDTVPAEPGAVARIGAPGQRWFAAEGPYEGSQAELALYSMSGGLFDDPEVIPGLRHDGRIRLRFENCDSGTVDYDIPSVGLAGRIPIQRANADNVARCLQEAQGVESVIEE
ncbi:MAG: DUF2202 domain-containing protein [Xanthomonadales bacterium]